MLNNIFLKKHFFVFCIFNELNIWIKYSLIFFLLLLSYSSLLINSIFGIDYLKVSLDPNDPFNLRNYFISNWVVANNFILSNITQTKIGDNILSDINDSNTFSTNGFLSSVLFPNYDTLLHDINESASSLFIDNNLKQNEDIINSSLYEFPKLISGTWVLNVTQGNVTNFQSAFKLVTSDGLEKHFVYINNFQNRDTNTIILNPYTYTILNGFADIKIDDQLFESHLPIKIEIDRINTIMISIDKQSINNLLFNNPIYGVVDSFKNFKNDDLLILNNQ